MSDITMSMRSESQLRGNELNLTNGELNETCSVSSASSNDIDIYSIPKQGAQKVIFTDKEYKYV